MKDVTHDDDINFRQRILEEISTLKPHAILPPAVSNIFLEHWFDRGEVEPDTGEVGMGAGKSGGHHALSCTKVHEGLVVFPWEVGCDDVGRTCTYSAHRAEKPEQPIRIGIQ